jgi:YVTN family beta-propeller protein
MSAARGPANWKVAMIKQRTWSICGLAGRSFLPVIGGMVLTGMLTAAAQPSASRSATSIGRSARVIATIPLGRQLAYNVATDPVTHMVYVTEPKGLAVINGRTDKLVTTIPLPRGPHGGSDCPTSDILLDRLCNLATDPLTGRVYVTDAARHAVLVIDGRTNKVVATIQVGGFMYWIAADPLTGKVYVQDGRLSGSQVAVIDGRTDTVVARVPETGPDPEGIATDPLTNMIYVADGSTGPEGVLVIDGRTNKTVATVPGTGGYSRIAADPLTNTIYAAIPGAEGSGELSVINGQTDTVRQFIGLSSPVGIATDPLTRFVYIADFNDVVVINGRTDTVTQTITLPSPTPGAPSAVGIATDPVANRVYVTNTFAHSVSVLAGSG